MPRKISVELVGDSRSLERAFSRSSRSATTFNRNIERGARRTRSVFRGLSSTLGAVGVAGVGVGIAAGVKTAVDAASDLNEQQNRTRVLFGKSAKAVLDWSETTANAIGLSSAAALEGAGNFGAMFETIGLADRPASSMSRRLVTLAADMASFNNQDPSEMLDRIRSGLAGEAEPLRRFGILLSESRIQQEAWRTGIARSGEKLTEQQKVLARYQVILRDAGVQVGDFQRTASSWANVQRRLTALLGNTAARIGQALLPALEKYGGELARWLAKEENQKRILDTVRRSVDFVTHAVDRLRAAWEKIESVIGVIVRVREELERTRKRMRLDAIGLAKDFVEPFSHLPRGAGGWARDLKQQLEDQIVSERADLRDIGAKGGSAIYEGMQMGLRGAAGDRAARRPALATAAVAPRAAVAVRRQRRQPITAAQRNQWFDASIARQLDRLQDLSLRKQLDRLREIAREVRARLGVTRDVTRRLTLEDELLGILRQQRSVQKEIGDQIRAANEALKERADAIKSAVIERLQRRQTDILNRRALADAREQLRIARQIGGPRGIREATRAVQDARFEMLRVRLERAPATLSRGGRFAFAGVVININGVTDPEAVARRVTEILQRRRRRTTTQTRGPAAATA